MNFITRDLGFIVAILVFFTSNGQEKNIKDMSYPIIPTPQEIEYVEGESYFESVYITGNEFSNVVSQTEVFFKERNIEVNKSGLRVQFIKKVISGNSSDEAYKLLIDEQVTIVAPTEKGAFYGLQSLKQIFRHGGQKYFFPKVVITDWPAFKIRGFMHDTGRNFQSVALLKEQLEIMAQYKYNIFHWHLTDNPGWRLESKKYPELQLDEVTTRQKGRFYTYEDFKEILAFCKERNITVIPELDIPGHTEAFRKALNIKTMRDSKVAPILLDLFGELLNLADADEIPYIHIGTDEVKGKIENVSNEVILEIMNLIKSAGREVIVWRQGIQINEDSTSINQLWASHKGRKGHRFIDSRSNYINHLDPFAGVPRLYFQQPCRQPKGDDIALGGILCAWPDNNIGHERDILIQNPIYPSMVFYADAIWKGRSKDYNEYWAKLPHPTTPEFLAFKTFEEKVITHRNLFFKGKEFPYIKQTGIQWKVIGPFNHNGDMLNSFPIEEALKDNYSIQGKDYQWQDSIVGATVHLKHFFGFPSLTKNKSGTYYAYTEIYSPDARIQDFWVGFQGWSRSSRRGGPTASLGQWHSTNPKIWVNKIEIAPPVWKQPNLGEETHETPFIDEDYFYRNPTKIQLKKGWNKVLLKIPQGGTSWKWMFTCVPINIDGTDVREMKDLKFRTAISSDY